MTKTTSALFAAACSTFVLMGTPLQAATCADTTQVAEALTDRFGEALYGNAVSSGGEVLEIYRNSGNENWTILVTLPDRGLSCLVASGTGDRFMDLHLASL